MAAAHKILIGLLVVTCLAVECQAQLRVSAFNIQTFGRTKMGKPDVVATLVRIINRYDLVLIQEIRDSTQTAIYQLLDEVNSATSDRFEMVLSDRLGRTTSKEQYAYFYRPSKLSVTDTYQYEDVNDVFERPPFTVRFSAPGYDIDDFAFLGIHVKPSDAVAEIDALVDVYEAVQQRFGMSDVLLGGDFNAGCTYVRPDDWDFIRLRTDSRFQWVIGDNVDTTLSASSCAYDRLVLAGNNLQFSYVSGSATAFRFDEAYGIDLEAAKEVSDHYPVDMNVR